MSSIESITNLGLDVYRRYLSELKRELSARPENRSLATLVGLTTPDHLGAIEEYFERAIGTDVNVDLSSAELSGVKLIEERNGWVVLLVCELESFRYVTAQGKPTASPPAEVTTRWVFLQRTDSGLVVGGSDLYSMGCVLSGVFGDEKDYPSGWEGRLSRS